MKKSVFLIVSLLLFLVTSCKKDKVCSCIGKGDNPDYEHTFHKVTNRNAIEGCRDYGATFVDTFSSCELTE